MLAEKGNYPVAMMARLLGVSRSGFYAWLKKRGADDPWAPLAGEIERIWLESKMRFGARKVLAKLEGGEFAGTTLYRVRKIMRELGIRGIQPRAEKVTTDPDPKAKERPDLIKRDFTSPIPTYRLVGDITYLKTKEGWLYLATVIDLCTRMVVGWCISERMTAKIVVEALERAWLAGYVAEGAIFHSDRGSQYTSRLLAAWAKAHGVRLSVGRTGSCHDNAVAESFFGTLKNEWFHHEPTMTRSQARLGTIDFIESYYNRMRPHEAIGQRVPAEVMEEFFGRFDAALAEDVEGVYAAA